MFKYYKGERIGMRALLDTNIIIHRENKRVSNYSIGHLYRWLDKLKYDKVIHPYSIAEIKKYKDPETQEVIGIKLESYEEIKTIKKPDFDFLERIGIPEKSENDKIDNCLLYEVYLRRVDILITEDQKLRQKAYRLGLSNRVFSINSFISDATAKNPELIEYKMLAVKKVYCGDIDLNNNFFDSLRNSYPGFNDWFMRKCDEEAYICNTDDGRILGFLYLKTENMDENYTDIIPPFKPKRRLKVGTFKVESTGFRLGERFIKIIFDNALQRNVDEIYVTLFTDKTELSALAELLGRWGFVFHGTKENNGRKEQVLVKKLKDLNENISFRMNFPNIDYNCNKFILPILPQYHTTLLPDSKLKNENEVDFLGKEPHRYALQKVYITWAPINGAKPGDLILFYRMGAEGTIKKYSSVITSVGLLDEVIKEVNSQEESLRICQNRSVFSTNDLIDFWRKHRDSLKIIKFIFVKNLEENLILGYLWEQGIITPPKGPRPFTRLTNKQYDQIIKDSKTEIKYVES